jgi:NAD(P)-dependent dehydrogenase (short-subunit alcohol dehydrogenase family)
MTGKVTEGTKVMASKVWFITGTSRGFGHIWARAALARGDRVAATARDVGPLQPLVVQYGDRVAAITLAVRGGARGCRDRRPVRQDRRCREQRRIRPDRHGRRSQRSSGKSPDRNRPIRRALGDPSGAAAYARADVRPHHQVSSIAGITTFPDLGLYSASKWGLEGFSRSLALEVAEFGIKADNRRTLCLQDQRARHLRRARNTAAGL